MRWLFGARAGPSSAWATNFPQATIQSRSSSSSSFWRGSPVSRRFHRVRCVFVSTSVPERAPLLAEYVAAQPREWHRSQVEHARHRVLEELLGDECPSFVRRDELSARLRPPSRAVGVAPFPSRHAGRLMHASCGAVGHAASRQTEVRADRSGPSGSPTTAPRPPTPFTLNPLQSQSRRGKRGCCRRPPGARGGGRGPRLRGRRTERRGSRLRGKSLPRLARQSPGAGRVGATSARRSRVGGRLARPPCFCGDRPRCCFPCVEHCTRGLARLLLSRESD